MEHKPTEQEILNTIKIVYHPCSVGSGGKERNAKIIRLGAEGVPNKEIAKEFKLTKNRIAQIITRYKIEKEIEKKSEELIKLIIKADNLNKKWPLIDLVNTFYLSSRSRNLVIKYFSSANKKEICLNELIDSITPRDFDSNLNYSRI